MNQQRLVRHTLSGREISSGQSERVTATSMTVVNSYTKCGDARARRSSCLWLWLDCDQLTDREMGHGRVRDDDDRTTIAHLFIEVNDVLIDQANAA